MIYFKFKEIKFFHVIILLILFAACNADPKNRLIYTDIQTINTESTALIPDCFSKKLADTIPDFFTCEAMSDYWYATNKQEDINERVQFECVNGWHVRMTTNAFASRIFPGGIGLGNGVVIASIGGPPSVERTLRLEKIDHDHMKGRLKVRILPDSPNDNDIVKIYDLMFTREGHQ